MICVYERERIKNEYLLEYFIKNKIDNCEEFFIYCDVSLDSCLNNIFFYF